MAGGIIIPDVVRTTTVTFLVGLPGSGKTELGKRMLEQDKCATFYDDISYQDQSKPTSTDQLFFEALKRAKPSDSFIVADVYLCEKPIRDMAVKTVRTLNPHACIRWIFFENSPEKCIRNVAHRNDGREVIGSIERFSKSYVIPPGPVREIWQSTTGRYYPMHPYE